MSEVPEDVRKWYAALGKKGSATLKRKYGNEYFKKIAAKRKTVGNFKKRSA